MAIETVEAQAERPGQQGLPELRGRRPVHRAHALQAHVRDANGRQRRRFDDPVSAARDRPGHLRQLPQRARHHPRQGPVRHRPDRQELPQRGDHEGLHLPHPRVRAGGAGVLLRAGHRRPVVRALEGAAVQLVPEPGPQEGQPAVPRPRPGRAGPLRQGVRGRGVPLPVRQRRLAGARRHRQPHGLRPAAAPARHEDPQQVVRERPGPDQDQAGGRGRGLPVRPAVLLRRGEEGTVTSPT